MIINAGIWHESSSIWNSFQHLAIVIQRGTIFNGQFLQCIVDVSRRILAN